MSNKALRVGDHVPEFTLLDQNGEALNMKDHLGQGPLVIYFYPKDDTPGCTVEACSFRDQFEEFTDLGAKVFGISADSPASHLRFKNKYRLPFDLLSDKHKKVQKLFGVKKNLFGLIDGRATYVVNKEGKIVYIFHSQLQPKKHIEEALKILEKTN